MKMKVLKKSTVAEHKIKNLKSHIRLMLIIIILFQFVFVGPYIYNELPDIKVSAVLFIVGFDIMIIWIALDYALKSYRKLKDVASENIRYTIVDTYLLRRTTRESSDEHGDSDVMTFWCGERFGIIDAFHAGGLPIKGMKVGSPFYVAVYYSYDKGKYVGEFCFSKYKYEADEELKNIIVSVSYEEYQIRRNQQK